MLIRIHESVLSQLEEGGLPSAAAKTALQQVAMGRREGKHLLFGRREVLDALRTSHYLDGMSRAVFNHVLGGLPQMGALIERLVQQVEVVGDDEVTCPVALPHGEGRLIRVPLSRFCDSGIVQETLLLTEHVRDCDVIMRLARAFAVRERYGHITLRGRALMGGGATIVDVYGRCQDEQDRFCLCIVDSDRAIPGGRLGATARAVIEVDDDSSPLSEVHILSAREIENLLPTPVIEAALVKQPQRRAMIPMLRQFDEKGSVDFRLYLDLKAGTFLDKALAKGRGSPEAKFWLRAYDAFPKGAKVEPECVENGSCQFPGECCCYVTPAFGDRLLEHSLEVLSRVTDHKLAEQMADGTLDPAWTPLGGIVVAWCCAGQRIAA